MTTQVPVQDEQTSRELGALIGMTTVTLAVLGAIALWQLRPDGQMAPPHAASVTSAAPPADILGLTDGSWPYLA